jgi:alanyl-tRNA synthetase
VEIEGYDCAACTGDHVSNTSDCSCFLVSGLSRSGGYLKVEFLVGEGARRRALEMCAMGQKAAEVLGVRVEKLEGSIESLKQEAYVLRGRLRDATDEALRRIAPEELADIRIYSACLKGVDERVAMERAGDIVERDPRGVVVFGIGNKSLLIVLARGASSALDCRAALKDALGSRGFRGGGKSNFANGTVSSGSCDEIVSAVVELVRHSSSR